MTKLNAFIIFSNEHREEVRQAHPDLSITEVAKELGRMWRCLSQSEKDSYK